MGTSSGEAGNGVTLVEVMTETMVLNELTEKDDIVKDGSQG